MTRLDRYMLRTLAGPFLFFVLVFTGVIWLSQSLRVIDTVVNNGQSARVFLEFAMLLVPTVMSVVLPVSAFAATLYAINRLYSDSEIVVVFAAGLSGLRLLRPVAMFSLVVMAVTFVNAIYLVPLSKREMRSRITEIRGDVAAAFLREGAFVSPSRGVTVYLREMGRPGEMLGIFVHDERDMEQIVTYTAERAVMYQDGDRPILVMFDGIAQTSGAAETTALSILRFEQFSYDLGAFTEAEQGDRVLKPSELFLPRLLSITDAETGRRGLGEFRAEAHEAISSPLYVLALPLLGASFVVSAGFRRQGFMGRIVMSTVVGVLLRLSGLGAKSAVSGAAFLWPLLYLPPLIGIVAALWLMSGKGMMPFRQWRVARLWS